MKKVLYVIMFAFVAVFSVTSCTEQEVKPANEAGTGLDPKK